MSNKKISIIIPVYNGKMFIKILLDSILENVKYPNYEVIVVDDFSYENMDEVYNLYKDNSKIKIIYNRQNLGFAKSNNVAVSYSSGEYLYFTNSDTIILENTIENIIFSYENRIQLYGIENIGAIQSKIIKPTENNNYVIQTIGAIIDREKGLPKYFFPNISIDDSRANRRMIIELFMGCGFFMPRDIWNELEGFDENFGKYYLEDTDLALRLREAGYLIGYEPTSVIVHFHGVSTTAYVKDQKEFDYNYQKSLNYFFNKWPKDKILKVLK